MQGGQLGLQNDSLEEEAVYIDTEGNVHKRGVKTNQSTSKQKSSKSTSKLNLSKDNEGEEKDNSKVEENSLSFSRKVDAVSETV